MKPALSVSLGPSLRLRAVFVILLLLPMSISGVQAASTSTTPSCDLAPEFFAPAVSNSTALSLALTSPQFLTEVSGQTYYLNGVAASWNSDAGCIATLVSLDANFIVTNSLGVSKDVVVALGVSADMIPISVFAVKVLPVVSFASSSPSPNWSGYQFCNGHNSGGAYCQNPPVNAIVRADGSWTQPSVVKPSGNNQPGCSGNPGCDLAIWTGVDTSVGGGNFLQTGSDVYITLYGLTSTPSLWWQDYPTQSSANFCYPYASQQGDLLKSYVYWSISAWIVYTLDVTTSFSCTSNPYPYTWSHTAYWADFIVERAGQLGGGIRSLAQFSSFYLEGKTQQAGSPNTYPITTPYNDLWYQRYWMQNIGVNNVCSGTWTSPNCYPSVIPGSTGMGKFNNVWITSQNT